MAELSERARLRSYDDSGAARLHLSLALNDCDHVRDLVTGTVRVNGVVVTPSILPVEEIFYRFTRNFEWDVSEMSFAKYLAIASGPKPPIVAIPVFTSRVFRHSAIYVAKDSKIASAKELEGKRVGIPEWAQTAGIYVRGFLSENYGVNLRSINWIQAGVNQAGRVEKVALNLGPDFKYQSRPDATIDQMLLSGEIDAAITARAPPSFLQGDERIERLFANYRADELKFFQATHIFPIMHVVTLRRDVFEANRWIATNLLEAFDAAKNRSLERLRDITAAGAPLPWIATYSAEVEEHFGKDYWPYGVELSRPTLDAFCRYAWDQRVGERALTPEELFPVEVLSSVKV